MNSTYGSHTTLIRSSIVSVANDPNIDSGTKTLYKPCIYTTDNEGNIHRFWPSKAFWENTDTIPRDNRPLAKVGTPIAAEHTDQEEWFAYVTEANTIADMSFRLRNDLLPHPDQGRWFLGDISWSRRGYHVAPFSDLASITECLDSAKKPVVWGRRLYCQLPDLTIQEYLCRPVGNGLNVWTEGFNFGEKMLPGTSLTVTRDMWDGIR